MLATFTETVSQFLHRCDTKFCNKNVKILRNNQTCQLEFGIFILFQCSIYTMCYGLENILFLCVSNRYMVLQEQKMATGGLKLIRKSTIY
jgi:hypothetical protein